MLTPPPARSTLFPYTTLFRSYRAPGPHLLVGAGPGARAHRARARAGPRDRGAGHRERTGDRKSTRLNSTHANSSYAVFCFQTKTTATPIPHLRQRLPAESHTP